MLAFEVFYSFLQSFYETCIHDKVETNSIYVRRIERGRRERRGIEVLFFSSHLSQFYKLFMNKVKDKCGN